MYHFFVAPEQIGEKEIWIEGSDVNHIRNVLRMTPGEKITVSSGADGKEYFCEIRRLQEDQVIAEILEQKEASSELPSKLALFQGLPKSDKMELIIQKAVELGAYEVDSDGDPPRGRKARSEKRGIQTKTLECDRRECCKAVEADGDTGGDEGIFIP